MTNLTAENLSQAWGNVRQNSAKAIDWLSQVRDSVASIDNEADSIILDLRRMRNKGRQLKDVALRPVAVGFFGLSQAGKSYLISSLAADKNGKLITNFDGQQLDFIEHVNPHGGGTESTGLVTRFGRIKTDAKLGYPIELKIFREVELAKVLLNSYFKDFDHEKQTYAITAARINSLFKELEGQVSEQEQPVSEDDVVELQDYVLDNFKKSLSALEADYWRRAANLVPKLDVTQRAKLFSILWGEVEELTKTYAQLANTLVSIGSPQRVFASLQVLQNKEGVLSQAHSIMNVNTLELLNSNDDYKVDILVEQTQDDAQTPVADKKFKISLAELTVLTTELVFPLINPTRVAAVEKVDLLDFPGYRGRLRVASFKDVSKGNPASQLLLRGKVAYLFEKYTDSQEMTVLVMCTPSDSQLEVNDVGPVLERWVEKIHGKTAEDRANIKPNLLWAITKFDNRITANLSKSEESLKGSWGSDGLLKQTILERFGNYDWLKNWSDGKAFNNVFLVRKPGLETPFIKLSQGKEIEIFSESASKLSVMRSTFVADKGVQTYVANPGQAWDSMLILGDGGMNQVSNYLAEVATPDVKQQMLARQLNKSINDLVIRRFDRWHQGDRAAEVLKKKTLADLVLNALVQRGILFGELLDYISLPESIIQNLYSDDESFDNHSFDDSKQNEEDYNAIDLSIGIDINFGDTTSNSEARPIKENKPAVTKFVTKVLQKWTAHLNSLTQDSGFNKYFGLAAEVVSGLSDELKTGSNRLKLANKLSDLHNKYEVSSLKKDVKEERIVYSICQGLKDYIAWLGIWDIPYEERPDSLVNIGSKIFEVEADDGQQRTPQLNNVTMKYMQKYVADWCLAFKHLAMENAGFSAAMEISSKQNLELGEILNLFKENEADL